MRKIKKINGFLVVKFNDREKREYEGTALGEYGVIDAEVYTGNLDIDRGAMEYDDADTLEVAVELARGLESEEDITDEPPTYTAAVETNESYTEEAVEPTALIEGWTRRLATQVKSKHYPDTDPRTAAHELYGFKMALHQIGFLPESEVITDPDTFGAGRLDGPMPRNPEELLAFVCDERCKNRAGHTQEELDAICAKCPLGQLYEDAEAQDLRIRERSERALREHIEGVRHAEDTLTALLGGHEALAYEDAKVNIELIIDDTPSQTKYQRYATLRAIFRSPGQSVPQPIPIISEDTAAHGVEKVIFKKLSHKGENKRGQLTATLELWEYIPQTITAKSGSSSGSGKSGGGAASNLKADYKSYLSNDRGKSPARDDADTTAAMNKVTAMPY